MSTMTQYTEEDHMDVDETTLLKSQVTKRKGRGFGGNDNRESTTDAQYERGDFDGDESIGTTRAQRSIEGWIILVTGLHEETTEEDLLDKFAEYGDVKNLHLNLDRRTGYVKGYALLEFEKFSEAEAARTDADNSELLGKQIHVDFAFVRGVGGSKVSQEVVRRRELNIAGRARNERNYETRGEGRAERNGYDRDRSERRRSSDGRSYRDDGRRQGRY